MAYEWKDVLIDGYQEIDAERAAAFAELESARQNEDPNGVRCARNKILELDTKRQVLDRHANTLVRSQQSPAAPPGFESHRREDQQLAAKFGLTPEQFDHATCWTDQIPKEQRIQEYFRNKSRYDALRAGGYRDEGDLQGRR